ncbi:hypothetical protein SAMN04489761_4381 [Tenacibaculum sp. MAR_2009_124]|nr:hypothetical protein [Tenacibaculum sp. MAR_2009_124]SED13419.1 hypothetical protein SAMN04489761_4381 [Tenacibaculum sp. MAR_2009_124]
MLHVSLIMWLFLTVKLIDVQDGNTDDIEVCFEDCQLIIGVQYYFLGKT